MPARGSAARRPGRRRPPSSRPSRARSSLGHPERGTGGGGRPRRDHRGDSSRSRGGRSHQPDGVGVVTSHRGGGRRRPRPRNSCPTSGDPGRRRSHPPPSGEPGHADRSRAHVPGAAAGRERPCLPDPGGSGRRSARRPRATMPARCPGDLTAGDQDPWHRPPRPVPRSPRDHRPGPPSRSRIAWSTASGWRRWRVTCPASTRRFSPRGTDAASAV